MSETTAVRRDQTFERVEAPDRATWRAWLAANHESSPGCWLVYYKKESGRPTVTYDEAVEEALCYGWIDSRPNKMDEQRYRQLFTPRKPKSAWSTINKGRVEKLEAAGLIEPAGRRAIELAKANGSWNAYDAFEDTSVPPELEAAFAANPTAAATFERYTENIKKQTLAYVRNAKRDETRAKRVTEVIEAAEGGSNIINEYMKRYRS